MTILVTLQHIIDKYDNDSTFTTKLLNSLRAGFEMLPQQVTTAVETDDGYELGRILHKMLPTIRMVENKKMEQGLEALRMALAEGNASEARLQQLTDAIQASAEYSLRYIDTLSKRVAAQKEQLPEPS